MGRKRLFAMLLLMVLPACALAVTGKTYALELYSLDEERSKKPGFPVFREALDHVEFLKAAAKRKRGLGIRSPGRF